MKLVLLVLSIIVILFPSCTPDTTLTERDIYLISVSDDFYNENKYGTLKTTISDQAALINQIGTLGNVHVYAFVSHHGKRYISTPDKAPLFKPADSACNILESPMDDAFDHFEYIPSSTETTNNWTMDDVLTTVGSLPTGEDDIIIFTYSGHGEENTGALITYYRGAYRDAQGKLHLLHDTTNREAVIEAFSSISGKKIFFLDSCFSGNFISQGTLNTLDTFTTDEDQYEGEDYISAIKCSTLTRKTDTTPSLWIMAAAGRKQKANDSTDDADSAIQEHFGAFTYYLLKALGYNMEKNESEKKSSPLTFYSIYSYIMASFPSSEIKSQTPRTSLKRLDVKLR